MEEGGVHVPPHVKVARAREEWYSGYAGRAQEGENNELKGMEGPRRIPGVIGREINGGWAQEETDEAGGALTETGDGKPVRCRRGDHAELQRWKWEMSRHMWRGLGTHRCRSRKCTLHSAFDKSG